MITTEEVFNFCVSHSLVQESSSAMMKRRKKKKKNKQRNQLMLPQRNQTDCHHQTEQLSNGTIDTDDITYSSGPPPIPPREEF